MLDKIFDGLKVDNKLQHMSSLLNTLNQLIAHVGEEYMTDGNLRNDALDCLSSMLLSLKKSA